MVQVLKKATMKGALLGLLLFNKEVIMSEELAIVTILAT